MTMMAVTILVIFVCITSVFIVSMIVGALKFKYELQVVGELLGRTDMSSKELEELNAKIRSLTK